MTDSFPFLDDLLAQPKALQDVIDGYDPSLLAGLKSRLERNDFERVIITGMGASLASTYPTWLALVHAGLPAYWMDTSELIAYAPELITPRTLLWIVSNSGQSLEVTRLLEQVAGAQAPFVLANTNAPDSNLAQKAGLVVPLYTGKDLTLSTRSYIGTLAVTRLMVLTLTGQPIDREKEDLAATVSGLREYLDRREEHLARLDEQFGKVGRLLLIGRGDAFASAMEGSLVFKEGPKVAAEGMTTGQFWHGPIELADPDLTLIVLPGSATRRDDERLALKTRELGANVVWFDDRPHAELETVLLPAYRGFGRTIAEILPVQLESINVGRQSGFRPGEFRYLNKVISTRHEL